MVLRERHRPRIEPAVYDLGRALHSATALCALAGKAVEIGAVKFYIARNSALLFKLRLGAHNLYFTAVGADPDGQGRAPVPVAGKSPVYDVFEEIAHSALFYGFGHPVDRAVGGNYFVLDLCNLYEPARLCVIQKGCIATPAVGIIVLVRQDFE